MPRRGRRATLSSSAGLREPLMPDAGFSIRGSGAGGATGTQGNYGVQSHQAGAAHGRVPGKASPSRTARRLPNGSSSLRLKLSSNLWRISLVNRLSASRSGTILTCDNLVPNEVNYQTALHSDSLSA